MKASERWSWRVRLDVGGRRAVALVAEEIAMEGETEDLKLRRWRSRMGKNEIREEYQVPGGYQIPYFWNWNRTWSDQILNFWIWNRTWSDQFQFRNRQIPPVPVPAREPYEQCRCFPQNDVVPFASRSLYLPVHFFPHNPFSSPFFSAFVSYCPSALYPFSFTIVDNCCCVFVDPTEIAFVAIFLYDRRPLLFACVDPTEIAIKETLQRYKDLQDIIAILELDGLSEDDWTLRKTFQRYKDLQDIIAILELDELSEDGRLTVPRTLKIERLGYNENDIYCVVVETNLVA
ncbi:hypothetical protein LXL04_006088 [Taraxacum kok-saghyz]